MSLMTEFKAFAMRGNVVDLAVAVVIGAAFGKIIASLVDGIIMPLIGLLLGGIDISGKTFQLGDAVVKWGLFLQSIIDFTLIALAIFVVIKLLNTLQKQEAKETKEAPPLLKFKFSQILEIC
jgi:large conductance mechanosensitive channel